MAERSVTRADTFGYAVLYTWTGLLNGDTGAAVEMPEYGDRTVQITGTFGVGGTLVLQGSNDGTNWFSLTDPQGNLISKTAAAGENVMETPRYTRPIVTAGDGSTSLVVTIFARRTQR